MSTYQYPTAAGAAAADGLFDEPAPAPAFPRIVLHTTVAYEGFTFDVTFNDTSIGDAVTVLKRRGCAPAQPVAGEPPGRVSDTAQIPPAHFTADGAPTCQNPNCSRYGKPLEPSAHNGLYCPGKDATTGNKRGYCKSTA